MPNRLRNQPDIVRAGFTYFFIFGGMSALLPYFSIYYKQVGLNGKQIGLLLSIPALGALVSGPLWGSIGDITQRHKHCLLVALLGSATCVFGISQAGSFALLVPMVAGMAFFFTPILPFLDHTTLEALGEQRDRYGQIRLWGTVGWGIIAPLNSIMLDRMGGSQLWLCFTIYILFLLIVFAISLNMNISRAKLTPKFREGLRMIGRDARWKLFLFTAFISGTGIATLNFFFLHLENENYSKTFFAAVLGLAILTEIPPMIFGKRLLKIFRPQTLVQISLLLNVFRLFGLGLADSGSEFLLVQIVNGPAFGLLWVGGVARTRELAPEGMGATAQTLFMNFALGLGIATGSNIFGRMMDVYGASRAFILMGYATTACLLVVVTFRVIINRFVVPLPTSSSTPTDS